MRANVCFAAPIIGRVDGRASCRVSAARLADGRPSIRRAIRPWAPSHCGFVRYCVVDRTNMPSAVRDRNFSITSALNIAAHTGVPPNNRVACGLVREPRHSVLFADFLQQGGKGAGRSIELQRLIL